MKRFLDWAHAIPQRGAKSEGLRAFGRSIEAGGERRGTWTPREIVRPTTDALVTEEPVEPELTPAVAEY